MKFDEMMKNLVSLTLFNELNHDSVGGSGGEADVLTAERSLQPNQL